MAWEDLARNYTAEHPEIVRLGKMEGIEPEIRFSHGNHRMFDILYYDPQENSLKISSDRTIPTGCNAVAICIIPSGTLEDGEARFVGLYEASEKKYGSNRRSYFENHDSSSRGWWEWCGKENTQVLIEHSECEAALWCAKEQSFFETLEWFLPAIGELRAMITYKYHLNELFEALGGDVIGDGGWCWSSSEYSSGHARTVSTYTGSVDYYFTKSLANTGSRVRAFIALP